MKINITKNQYETLLTMCGLANSMVGIMGDELTEESGYKKKSDDMEALQEYLMQFAKEMELEEWVEKYEGKYGFDDDIYEEEIVKISSDYDEHIMYSSLANKLAWRDFRRDHSEEEIKKMAKKNSGYFGVALYDYEKKYCDEFEKNGVERLEVGEKVAGEV